MTQKHENDSKRGNPICAARVLLGAYAREMVFLVLTVRVSKRMSHLHVKVWIWAMRWRCVIVLLSVRGSARMPHVQVKNMIWAVSSDLFFSDY